MSKNRIVTRSAAALGVATLTTLTLGAGLASAHVHATAQHASKGGYGKITFSVPNEEKAANTVKVEVDFPKDHPVPSVSTKPIPGWHAQVTKVQLDQPVKTSKLEIKEAVASVVWTADPGTKVAPGEFGEFDVSAGPLPEDTDQLVLPATQTYDDGTVVKWADVQAPGQPEPEHPAPTVKLAAKAAGDGDGDADAAAMPGMSADAKSDSASGDTTARVLGGAGLGVGVLGLIVGGVGLARGRKTTKPGGEQE